jgi:hypothetical protein
MSRGACLVLLALVCAAPPATRPAPPVLELTLAKTGWGDASRDDAEAVLRSAAEQLLPHFPDVRLEPLFVQPFGGPITLFERNADGQVVVKLATTDARWAQYAFQFAHELGHVLCRFDDRGDRGNHWFEESVCELASLYTLRRMGERWRTAPPYRNWRDYAKHLTAYAQARLDGHPLPDGQTLGAWYAVNAGALRKNPTDRRRSTTVAAALLPLFERTPAGWAAIHYLNQNEPDAARPFARHLQRWHDECPEEHKQFVRAVANEFDVALR